MYYTKAFIFEVRGTEGHSEEDSCNCSGQIQNCFSTDKAETNPGNTFATVAMHTMRDKYILK